MYYKLEKDFEENSNKESSQKMSAYMRDLFSFYGIPSPKRKEIYKEFFKEEKRKGKIDWLLLDKAWGSDYREFQYFAMDYLIAMHKFLNYEDIDKIKKYLKSKQWWDSIDILSGVIDDISYTDIRFKDLMLEWSIDSDFWIRRVSIIHQLGKKDKTDVKLLEKILINNFGSDEFFINKAIGWALREYSKTNPKWVRDFINKHNNKMNKLSIREGSKYI